MAQRVVGVDFAHDRIRAADVADPGTRRARVLRRGSVPLEPGAIVSGEVRDVAAVAAGLKRLWQQAGFRSRRVVLGLGNARVLARDLDVPARPPQQIREQLPFLAADLLPMPFEQAVLDFYPIHEFTDEQGVDMLHGMLVVGLKDIAMTNARAAEQAGLETIGIDMIPFALIRHLADADSTETVAYIHVGATTTIISVAVGAMPVFCRIVPVGGEEVTRSLVELGQLSRDQAEQVKATIGLSAEGVEPRYRPVVELMVTRTSELMTSIRDTVSYYTDTKGRSISRIVLTGGGAKLGGFAQMVAAWTRIPTALAETPEEDEHLVAISLASGARQVSTKWGHGQAREASAPPRDAPEEASAVDADGTALTPPPAPAPEQGPVAAPAPESAPVAPPPPPPTDTAAVPVVSIDEPSETLGLPGGIDPGPLAPPTRRARWWRRGTEEAR